MGADDSSQPDGRNWLCHFIREHRESILAEWERRVRSLPTASSLPQPRLLDHLPSLLQQLADEAGAALTGGSAAPNEAPEVHALHRLDEGFSMAEVTEEYAVLRACILRLYREHQREAPAGRVGPTLEEIEWLNQAIDAAVIIAVGKYAKARERTLMALDRLSEAALESGDVQQFLPRLLRILLETTEWVDSAVILLREDDRLVARAAAGLEEEVSARFTLRVGEGFSGKIAAERRPLELRSAATDPLVKSELIRARGIRALYGVPLMDGDNVLGVAHIGSCTSREFSKEDKLLFRTMASRAAALLVQARLREEERLQRQRAEQEHARAQAERLRAEEALARVDALLSSTTAGMAFLDKELRYVRLNEALAETNGVPLEAHLGHTPWDVLPESTTAKIAPPLRRVLETGEAQRGHEFTAEIPGRPGVPHHWMADFFPVRARGGELMGVGAIVMDVTERVRVTEALTEALQERQRAVAALDTERQRLEALTEVSRLLFESRLDLATLLDATVRHVVEKVGDLCILRLISEDGHTLSTQAAHARAPEVEELTRATLDHYAQQVFEGVSGQVLQTGQPLFIPSLSSAELARLKAIAVPEYRSLFDQLQLQSLVVIPLRTSERLIGTAWMMRLRPGSPYTEHDFALFREIAARAAIAIDNARLLREAQEAARVREDVVAIVSHDLRNPLNAITMTAGMLIKRDELDARTAKAATRIHSAADRANRLIQDLLDFTQARVGGIPVQPQAADLEVVVEQVLEEVRSAYPERRIELSSQGAGRGAFDPSRMAQVVANLVGNAVQHSPSDTPVRVELRGDEGHVLLEVHNGGSPIPAEALPTLFEPFQRGPRRGGNASRSLGLGLYITCQIVQAHHGTIKVSSSAAEGTTLTVRLPRAPARQDPKRLAAPRCGG